MVEFNKDGAQYLPLMDQGPPIEPALVQFDRWWQKERIFKFREYELTRKRLVFALRNQDGGAHVGPLTDPHYVKIKTAAFFSFVKKDGTIEPLFGAIPASMRHIGWEMLKTLDGLGDLSA